MLISYKQISVACKREKAFDHWLAVLGESRTKMATHIGGVDDTVSLRIFIIGAEPKHWSLLFFAVIKKLLRLRGKDKERINNFASISATRSRPREVMISICIEISTYSNLPICHAMSAGLFDCYVC